MLRFTCYFYVSEDEGIMFRTPSNAKYSLSVELLDEDLGIDRVRKLELFTRNCDRLKKVLCEIYPTVSIIKVREQIKIFHRKN